LENNINITKKNAEYLINAIKKVGLEVNVERTKHILISHNQNAGQNHNIKITNGAFENMAKFKYFGTTTTNKNVIHEEIKSRLNWVMLASIQFRSFC
jgi:di/tripeptidase